MEHKMLTIVGPTACGKTALAVRLAERTNGEIISGDSRQIYRGMTLGTGKDLEEYNINGKNIRFHLIDIADPGVKYNIYNYQHDFSQAYEDVISRGKTPILCGGSGMYVECVLRGYRMTPVPENTPLRNSLAGKELDELTEILKSYGKKLHNTTDVDTPKRAIRAIEIEDYYSRHPIKPEEFSQPESVNFCLEMPRELRWQRITKRLEERLEAGMVDEIRSLIGMATENNSRVPSTAPITPEELMYYGLEYKYVTLYAIGKIKYSEMFEKLNIAIRQFAKRQMTWFRGMERRGIKLHWLDATKPIDDIADTVIDIWEKHTSSTNK